MIRIQVITENNNIKEITLKGHANYEEYGKDIVCAAVSATYLCTVNACYSSKPNSLKLVSKASSQRLIVTESDSNIQILLHNLVNCLNDLQDQYPKNIKLDKEEK